MYREAEQMVAQTVTCTMYDLLPLVCPEYLLSFNSEESSAHDFNSVVLSMSGTALAVFALRDAVDSLRLNIGICEFCFTTDNVGV